MPPQVRKQVARLLKVFILDAQGGYAGEYVADPECVVEYGDVLAAVPEAGLADQQTIFLGECRATALHGERVSLVAISKGPLDAEAIAWAKAALTAVEAQLTGDAGSNAPAEGPDKAVLESLASALKKQEEGLTTREKALAEAEERIRNAAEAARRGVEAELEALRARLADIEVQRQEERKELEAERERLRKEVERVAAAPRPAGDASNLEAERKQFERDRKMLQRRALDLLAQEERLREREAGVAAAVEEVGEARKENEALLARTEAAQKPSPAVDVEAARREIDMRVKILQQKALDLLDREEKFRQAQEEIRHAGAP